MNAPYADTRSEMSAIAQRARERHTSEAETEARDLIPAIIASIHKAADEGLNVFIVEHTRVKGKHTMGVIKASLAARPHCFKVQEVEIYETFDHTKSLSVSW